VRRKPRETQEEVIEKKTKARPGTGNSMWGCELAGQEPRPGNEPGDE